MPDPRGTITTYRIATTLTIATVAMGSLVCATESGAACPTWPGCFPDRITPGAHLNPVIEWTHRVISIACGLSIAAAALAGRRLPRRSLARIAPWVALAGAAIAAILGRQIVLHGLSRPWGVVDLAASLIAMAALIIGAVAAPRIPYAIHFDRAGQCAWAAVGTTIVMHLTGVLTAAEGSFTRCLGWPIWRIIESDQMVGLQITRIILALATTALVITALMTAWQRRDLHRIAGILAGCGGAELAVGIAMGGQRLEPVSAALYSLIAVALLATMILFATRLVLEPIDRPQSDHPENSLPDSELCDPAPQRPVTT
ncbi:Heme A synthase [Austwickia sp. TVS 96-490-7B]|uniref:hypothetical protein n=1 Tax=Austwickia sp. TVS 96-490-7B TaxID=2830843 RepID=UPI001C55B5AA|nr:hypothetical protein [Austwickia sp. TVS 96-490-7B]MBW3085271.1 Heme A synthase [Austwickia sp. TVS 96-490-7B]